MYRAPDQWAGPSPHGRIEPVQVTMHLTEDLPRGRSGGFAS